MIVESLVSFLRGIHDCYLFFTLPTETMSQPATTPDDGIKKALVDVTAAADRYIKLSARSAGQAGISRDGVHSAGELTVSHNELLMNATQLVRAIRGPVDMLFTHFEHESRARPCSRDKTSFSSLLTLAHRREGLVLAESRFRSH